jgi:addiction module RelB/DinJ family antitoxin
MKDSVIRARISAALKDESARVLAACGLEPSEAIRLFLQQVVVHGGIPFDVRGSMALGVDGSRLRAMKRASQVRDRAIAERDDLSGGEMLLIRPEQVRGAQVRWQARGRR